MEYYEVNEDAVVEYIFQRLLDEDIVVTREDIQKVLLLANEYIENNPTIDVDLE
jgi:hypothetical protein